MVHIVVLCNLGISACGAVGIQDSRIKPTNNLMGRDGRTSQKLWRQKLSLIDDQWFRHSWSVAFFSSFHITNGSIKVPNSVKHLLLTKLMWIAHNFVQVNLCQKLLFLHQLTHNITTDCSLNYQFSTWKLQTQNIRRTCCVHRLFWMSKQKQKTICSDVLSL